MQITYSDASQLLAIHTSLTHLEIYVLSKIDPLCPSDLPNLQSIVALREIVAIIVPGRPVRSITILHPEKTGFEMPVDYDVYLAITRSTVPVAYLKVDVGCSSRIESLAGMLLQYFSNKFPDLEHLSLHGDTGYFGMSDDRVSRGTLLIWLI